MNKKSIIIISILGIIILIIGIILLTKNNIIKQKSKIEIYDATYACANTQEQFYEDEKYIYFFPCVKSSSVYVKLENGNKMLVTSALEAQKVTIDELINAGLKVYKQEK